jgi:hypothetical protein
LAEINGDLLEADFGPASLKVHPGHNFWIARHPEVFAIGLTNRLIARDDWVGVPRALERLLRIELSTPTSVVIQLQTTTRLVVDYANRVAL